MPTPPHIGTLNEGSLHAALKAHYQRPGDALEVPLGRFVIDLVRDPGTPQELLIEIQTGSFAAMGRKLDHLLESHRIRIVHPIAVRTHIEKPDGRRRISPKKGSLHTVLEQLVSFPTLLDNPNLSLDVVLVRLTKLREPDPRARRGRGGFRTVDTRLEEVLSIHHFAHTEDLAILVPDGLPQTFTTADLASAGGIRRDVAQRLAYCCHAVGLFEQLHRDRKGFYYRRVDRGVAPSD